MEREVVRLLPYILGGMFVIGVLLFLLALQQLRRRRTGTHWRMRRRAGERGGRLFVLSIGLMVVSVVLALISALVTLAHRNDSPAVNRGPDDLYGIVLSPSAVTALTNQAVTENVGEGAAPLDTATRAAATPYPPSATLTPLLPSQTAAPSSTLMPTVIPPSDTPSETVAPTADFARLLNLTPSFNT